MQTFLACTYQENDVSWLQAALANMGQVLRAGQQLDELLRLVDTTGAALVFVGMDRDNISSQCVLIESLLEAKPLLAVVVMGDGFDNELVIAAMRAGARDFLTTGLRSSEVGGLVRRLTDRLPVLPARREQGRLVVMYGLQPDPGAAFIAAHLGLQMLKHSPNTLLVALGVPPGECMDVLGLDPGFGFSDAARNLRRIDRSLIDSAFPEHESGLRVLPIGVAESRLNVYSATEVFLLIATLRQHFDQVLINLTGHEDSEVLRNVIGQADQLCWYVDPSVSCCRRNLELLSHWRNEGVKLENAQLLVDRCYNNVAPSAKVLSQTFEMPLLAGLPASAELRLRSVNQRRTLFQLAPRDALSKAIVELARQLVPSARAAGGKRRTGLLKRLLRAGK